MTMRMLSTEVREDKGLSQQPQFMTDPFAHFVPKIYFLLVAADDVTHYLYQT